jgi:16S rRNA (cytidine1402-2'-O)-methyltransferase
MPTLWIVATPIGNLEDLSPRAQRILSEADAIACEDTRHSLKLLSHFGIRKPLLSCYAYQEERGVKAVLARLGEGKNVAYVSDAGTPALSDPGSLLARSAREAGHQVVPVPGPSALACLMSVAGLGGSGVTFAGFLSPKAGRRRSRLKELMEREEAIILYESPYRILKLLGDVAAVDPSRGLCLGREMTKIHEEFLTGKADEIISALSGQENRIKGEFALMIAGRRGERADNEADGEGGEALDGELDDRSPGSTERRFGFREKTEE